jgi:hypothetical protein
LDRRLLRALEDALAGVTQPAAAVERLGALFRAHVAARRFRAVDDALAWIGRRQSEGHAAPQPAAQQLLWHLGQRLAAVRS